MVVPAGGYSEEQVGDLKETIDAVPCDVILVGTPVDLRRIMSLNKPAVRVRYELVVLGPVSLEKVVDNFLGKKKKTEKVNVRVKGTISSREAKKKTPRLEGRRQRMFWRK